MAHSQNKPKCKYCNGDVSLLYTNNHLIGCNLEFIAQVLRFREFKKEADELDRIASRIK